MAMLILIHSGQTGVERGAYRAARTLGLPVGGFCPRTVRDELGPLPFDIASSLLRSEHTGTRDVAAANLEVASLVIVAGPSKRLLSTQPGTDVLLRAARRTGKPIELVEPGTDLHAIAERVHALPPTADAVRVYVTGPRGTRWADGERLGFQIVAALVPPDALEVGVST